MKNKVHISIVSPVYKAEEMVEELVKQVIANVSKITDEFEIILVNDCSPDNSWLKIEQECMKDERVKGISLSRNFGQHYAISAGLNYTNGEYVVVMDCDLQDVPDEIPNLYSKAIEGWDIVYARRVDRQDSFFKKKSSQLFYKLFNYLSGTNFDGAIGNFGIYHKKVILEFNKMHECARDFSMLIRYIGFKFCTIDVKHSSRLHGKSSYSILKLFNLSLDIILSNSNKPLKITTKIGLVISIISLFLAMYNIIAKFLNLIDLPGYTTTIFSIWFIGGLVLFVLGIIGIYVGKIFDQVKGRQLYIISKEINVNI